jgi:hypothetical protein
MRAPQEFFREYQSTTTQGNTILKALRALLREYGLYKLQSSTTANLNTGAVKY